MTNKQKNSLFCIDLAIQWMNNFPDWRFMQLINNFQAWIGSDGFYLEDDEFIEKFKQFINEIKKEA